MRAYDIIKNKRDGKELSREEIAFIVKGASSGSLPDYQISAFLMAVYFKGMTERETLDFTLEIASSGERFDLGFVQGVKADKHSTGGVGDKTSLIVAPIIASLGIKVIKMSGRGLGHTGGTVDKLEAIKGFKVELSENEFKKISSEVGAVIVGQSKNLAPADKVFYALRDVTATIDSIPLIASSIMGKKLAADDDVIVLDVKFGEGAFMKTAEEAEKLAKAMVSIGKGAGKKISALITDMNEPLGYYVGNAFEVKEAVDVLNGNINSDLAKVSLELASEILYLSGYGELSRCQDLARSAILNGTALSKFKEFVTAQGGDLTEILSGDIYPKFKCEIKANKSGYILKINAEKVGLSSLTLGAGRNKIDDVIDYKAGIILSKKVGDRVEKGQTIATLYTSNELSLDNAKTVFESGIEIGDNMPIRKNIVIKKIS